MIDIDKFVASLMRHYYDTYNVDKSVFKCWLDDVLEDQGLEYKNGEIVKTQRRIAAEAKEALYTTEVDSEDEKIRKALVEIFSLVKENKKPVISKEDAELILTWLEKQSINCSLVEEIKKRKDFFIREKEKAVSSNDKLSLGARVAILEELLVFANEKQGEQKPILDFKASNWYISKVDGKIHDLTYNPTDKKELKKLTQSVTKISDKVWSEEDEKMLNQAIKEVEYALNDKNLIYTGNEDVLIWLKSIKRRLGRKVIWDGGFI